MPFNINTFRGNVQTGFLKPSKFDIQILIPVAFQGQQLGQFMLNTGGILQYYCTEAQLPGMTHLVGRHKHYGYGPMYKRPHSQPMFEDIELMFNNDAQGLIWTFFNQWLNVVAPFNQASPVSNNPVGTVNGSGIGLTGTGQIFPWEVSFLDDYSTTMLVTQYMTTGDDSLTVQLNECYPIGMSKVRLNWAQGDAISTFSVIMAFRDWTQLINAPQINASVPPNINSINLLGP